MEQFPQSKKSPHFSIAVDPGNGAASGIASKIFTAFGYTVMPINDTPDGTFSRPQSRTQERYTGKNVAVFLKRQPAGYCCLF